VGGGDVTKKNQKVRCRNSKRKLQNIVKKNDKDEIVNILLKHVLPVYILAKKGGSA